jgi:uncharacterized protein YdaT
MNTLEKLLRRIEEGIPPDMLEMDPVAKLIMLSATGPCSLSHGGHNWITNIHEHLPNYACHIAKAIMRSGKVDESHAIAIAISSQKKWAAGHTAGISKHGVSEPEKVHPDTQARAAEGDSEWEALKAKAKAHKVGDDAISKTEHGFKDKNYDSRDDETKAAGKNDYSK